MAHLRHNYGTKIFLCALSDIQMRSLSSCATMNMIPGSAAEVETLKNMMAKTKKEVEEERAKCQKHES